LNVHAPAEDKIDDFSNRQLGMKVYMKLVMIMELENKF
jgi:hypothetical protein